MFGGGGWSYIYRYTFTIECSVAERGAIPIATYRYTYRYTYRCVELYLSLHFHHRLFGGGAWSYICCYTFTIECSVAERGAVSIATLSP